MTRVCIPKPEFSWCGGRRLHTCPAPRTLCGTQRRLRRNRTRNRRTAANHSNDLEMERKRVMSQKRRVQKFGLALVAAGALSLSTWTGAEARPFGLLLGGGFHHLGGFGGGFHPGGFGGGFRPGGFGGGFHGGGYGFRQAGIGYG